MKSKLKNAGAAPKKDDTGFMGLSGKASESPGGLLIEPFLTYEKTDLTLNTSEFPFASDSEGSSGGFGIGGRFGAHIKDVFFIAADGRFAQTQLEASIYDNTKSNQYNYGIAAGLQTPIAGLRVWAGIYIFAVSVNLEYQNSKYENTVVESWGDLSINSTVGTDLDSKSYLWRLRIRIL